MKNNKLSDMPMKQLLWNMSLPLMVSLLIQSLYNIVDSIFVARIGEEALTAASLAFPMHLLMIAVGVGTAVGVNAVLASALGRKDFQQARVIASTGIVLALIATVVFTLLGVLVSKPMTEHMTGDPLIQTYCYQYLSVCMIFCAGHFIATMIQRFLQAVGNTFGSMLSLAAGALTNLILDPIMIFGLFGFPKLGILGAAIATVTGQWISAFTAFLINRRTANAIHPEWTNFRMDKELLKRIYKVGLPTIVTQAMGFVMMTCFNKLLIGYASAAVAFFGVYYKLQSFLFMPMNGLGQALIPIVAYNYGAKNDKRVKEALKIAIPVSVGIAMAMSVIFYACPAFLLSLFNPSAEMLQIGVPAIRIICVTFALSSFGMIVGYAVSGMGTGYVNMITTLLRQFVILIPCAMLLIRVAGIDKVWYSIWIAEFVAFLYALYQAKKQFRVLETERNI